ncbi:PIN domain-containing protein [Komagataeibacter xylinus]|uniref:Ribonuclease VapC n=1 Tax=Komagataeibacter xylinus TaxID=28448 RepID=A0A318PDZ8_KOMXY|nr:PIN domain-containing protein [Komagataeibacter xylinus]PYD55450.1 PIN domain-containing protein [Komagataeibacter xylinus]GBQ75745.1 hypothetical protein AA15237_2139 [Komagataeibacter xylinus NBRC 15237]
MSVLLDTNVILYAILEDGTEKARIAEDLLLNRECHISVQTLNEALHTLRRKSHLSLDEIGELLSDIRSLCVVHDLTEAVWKRGWAIVERYGLQTYDSMIVACAIENDLEKVLSEDMHNGLRVFDMTVIHNPFVREPG